MKIRFWVFACTFIFSFQAFSQPVSTPPDRKNYVYVGLQANQLIRQLFSLGNPPSVTQATTTTEGGIGPRCGVYFAMAERVLLGTEASFYLTFGKETHKVAGTSLPAQPDRSFHNLLPSVPAALFLIVRF